MSGFLHVLVPTVHTDRDPIAPLLRDTSDKRDLRDSFRVSSKDVRRPSSPSSFESLSSFL
jgi:hypothetical protein